MQFLLVKAMALLLDPGRVGPRWAQDDRRILKLGVLHRLGPLPSWLAAFAVLERKGSKVFAWGSCDRSLLWPGRAGMFSISKDLHAHD